MGQNFHFFPILFIKIGSQINEIVEKYISWVLWHKRTIWMYELTSIKLYAFTFTFNDHEFRELNSIV